MSATPITEIQIRQIDLNIQSAESYLSAIRLRLAEIALNEQTDTDTLIDTAVRIKLQMQVIGVWNLVGTFAHHPSGTIEVIRDTLFSLILQGPDDTWSGRGNDVRRQEYDAKREAIKSVLSLLHIGL